MCALGVDLYTISGHKMYAPKGVGALYVRKGRELAPLLFGGRHERGRRAGNGEYAGDRRAWAGGRARRRSAQAEMARIAALRDRLEHGILARVPDAAVNGAEQRVRRTRAIFASTASKARQW